MSRNLSVYLSCPIFGEGVAQHGHEIGDDLFKREVVSRQAPPLAGALAARSTAALLAATAMIAVTGTAEFED